MATVSFTRNTDATVLNSDITTEGRITFNTGNNNIYLGNGGSYATFKGTDRMVTSGNTSSKIFLVGCTSQSTTAVSGYSHDTAYVGTDGYVYSDGRRCSTEWIALNGSTGIQWNTFKGNTTYRKAQRIIVQFKSAPIKLMCPSALYNCSSTTNVTVEYVRATGWGGFSSSTDYPNFIHTGGPIIQSSYSYNSQNYVIFGYLSSLYTGTNDEKKTMNLYYHYFKYNGTTFGGFNSATDWDTRKSSSDSIAPYIYVMAVQY